MAQHLPTDRNRIVKRLGVSGRLQTAFRLGFALLQTNRGHASSGVASGAISSTSPVGSSSMRA